MTIPAEIRVSKGSSQLSSLQLAQNQDCFCDFGRKLVNLTQADLDFLIFVQRNKTDSALCNCQYKNLKPPFDTLICRVKKAENPFAFSVRDYSAFLSSDLPVRMSLMINFDHYSSVSVLAVSVPFFHASNFFITAS